MATENVSRAQPSLSAIPYSHGHSSASNRIALYAMKMQRILPTELDGERKTLLGRSLRSPQIFMIAISGILGTGLFQNMSYGLSIAGPGGLILSFIIVGFTAICVMESIGEMVQLFPTPNFMSEVVRTFVDEELGLVVELLYWSSHALIYSGLVISAVNLTDYWNSSYAIKTILWTAIPIGLIVLNSIPMRWYGAVSEFVGMAKLALVLGLIVMMVVLAEDTHVGSSNISGGFQHDSKNATSNASAIFAALPLAAYAFVGIEIFTVTSFEARDPYKDLKFTAKHITWIVAFVYFIIALLTAINVPWDDARLSVYSNQGLGGLITTNGTQTGPKSLAIIVMTESAGWNAAPLNAILIWSVLTAANTSLYASSRTMFGLVRRLEGQSKWHIKRLFANLGFVDARTLTPWYAVMLTAAVSFWVPFVWQEPYNVGALNLQQILLNCGTVCCIMVWASQCLAYIRFFRFSRLHERDLQGNFYSKFRLNATSFSMMQPVPAWFGLISCLALLAVFDGASSWNGKSIALKLIGAYIAPLIAICTWIWLKLSRVLYPHRRQSGNLQQWSQFSKAIHYLSDLVYPTDYPVTSEDSRQAPPTTLNPNTFPMMPIVGFSRQTNSAETDSIFEVPRRFSGEQQRTSDSPPWRGSDELTRVGSQLGDPEDAVNLKRPQRQREDLPEIVIEKPESDVGSITNASAV